MPRPGPQAKKPSSRRSSRAFSKACGERLHQWKASRSSGSPQLPQEETSLKRAAQCSFCGVELYRFPPVDEKDGDLRSVPCCQRRIRVHVHFSELVRELAPQPLAQRPEIRTEVAPGPAIQFEVERRVGHRDGMRTVSRSSRPVNAPHPAGQAGEAHRFLLTCFRWKAIYRQSSSACEMPRGVMTVLRILVRYGDGRIETGTDLGSLPELLRDSRSTLWVSPRFGKS